MSNFLNVKKLVMLDDKCHVHLPDNLYAKGGIYGLSPVVEDDSCRVATTEWVRAYIGTLELGSGGGGISTEIDPVWLSEKGSYYTKLQADARYLQSFTELDPTVPAHVKMISTGNINNWTAAFTWGNHAVAGYLTSFTETDPIWTAEKGSYYTKTQADLRYLQSFTETDPTVPAHVKSITTINISNWTSAYNWGDHGSAGYLTSFTETDPIWTAEKVNYYTKTQGDARYLQSYTETDPIWTAEKGNYALKTYVDTSISNLINSAPSALDTLNELALALGNDANFSTTITTLIGTKEPIITAGTTAQYWRGDKTWQTLPVYTLSGLGGVPSTRTITINGVALDLSEDRAWTIAGGGTAYTLPTATTTVLGGVKIDGTSITINGSGVISASDTDTWIANSKDAAGYVAAPGAVANKVWKTDALGNPAWRDDADTDTVYVHPTTAGNKHIPAGGATGQILRWSADGTAVWGADNDTTYSVFTGATTLANGVAGLVTAPVIANRLQFLRGDGTWATPTDTNTTYDVFTGATTLANGTSGLVTAPVIANRLQFLRGDGTWATPTDTDTTYVAFTGATSLADGTVGLVAKPLIANRNQYLKGDGTWGTPPDTDTTYSVFTRSAAGLAPASGGTSGTAKYLREDGTWAVPPDTDTDTNTTYTAGTGLTLTGTVFSVTKTITTAATADTIALRDASGYLNAVAFFETSDIRFKNVLETNPIVSVDGIEVIKFTLKGSTEVRYGYSAQQVRQFVPEAVMGTDKLTVNYSDVHTLKIAALERKVAELEAKLNSTNA